MSKKKKISCRDRRCRSSVLGCSKLQKSILTPRSRNWASKSIGSASCSANICVDASVPAAMRRASAVIQHTVVLRRFSPKSSILFHRHLRTPRPSDDSLAPGNGAPRSARCPWLPWTPRALPLSGAGAMTVALPRGEPPCLCRRRFQQEILDVRALCNPRVVHRSVLVSVRQAYRVLTGIPAEDALHQLVVSTIYCPMKRCALDRIQSARVRADIA